VKLYANLKALAVSAAFLSTTALAQDEKVVNVYNWSDYIDESVLENFTKETGIKVQYDVFDSNELLETKMLAGKSGYDVVVPTGTFLSRQVYDPGNAYSVNYMWGTTGIGYNEEKVKEVLGADAPTDSLALFFDPKNIEKLSACGVHMLDAPTEIIPAALKYIGEDPNTKDIETIKKAEDVLLAIRPHILKFHSSEYINALANGDICAAFGWSGEGALMWFDQMAVPSDAPNPELAHQFIDYIMRAYVAAAASNYVNYANGNKAAQGLLNDGVINDPAIYPSNETMKNLYSVTAYAPKVNRVVTRLWTKVKTGQ